MDLRSEAIYALQQPYIRLHNPSLMSNKKFVKKVMKEESRHLGAATGAFIKRAAKEFG